MEYRIVDLLDCIQDSDVPIRTENHASATKIKELTMEKINTENRKNKRPVRKAARVALIAAVFVLLLSATAYATGFAQSVIGSLSGWFATPDAERDAKYEQAGELSNKEPITEDLSELAGSAITLEESYYDGEDLIIAYSLDAIKYSLEIGFGPGDENFDKLWKLSDDLDILWDYGFSEEEISRIKAEYEENGKVGFIVRKIGLGDHITMADGTDLGPFTGVEKDGKVVLESQNGLPEAAKGLKQLDLVIKVKSFVSYYYFEGDDIYLYSYTDNSEDVCFTIENCK